MSVSKSKRGSPSKSPIKAKNTTAPLGIFTTGHHVKIRNPSSKQLFTTTSAKNQSSTSSSTSSSAGQLSQNLFNKKIEYEPQLDAPTTAHDEQEQHQRMIELERHLDASQADFDNLIKFYKQWKRCTDYFWDHFNKIDRLLLDFEIIPSYSPEKSQDVIESTRRKMYCYYKRLFYDLDLCVKQIIKYHAEYEKYFMPNMIKSFQHIKEAFQEIFDKVRFNEGVIAYNRINSNTL